MCIIRTVAKLRKTGLFLPVVALYPPQAFRPTTGNTKGDMLIIRSTSVLVLAENAHLEATRKRYRFYSQFKTHSTALHIANCPFQEGRKSQKSKNSV